jgi:penicillin-binding protein 2
MNDEFGNTTRYRIAIILLACIFLGLSGRLVELQLIGGDEYGLKSRNNSLKKIMKEPGRGAIYDRNKKILVDTRPKFSLGIVPSDFDEDQIPELARILNLDSAYIIEKLEKGKNYSIFESVKIKREIDFKTISFFEENHDKFPGVEILPEPKRTYLVDARMSHILGYVKEITDEQLANDTTGYYRQGDYKGQKGIESAYEEYLRGTKGLEMILVNAQRKKIGKYNDGKLDVAPIDGADLNLSIDSDLQLLAETLIADKRGAVVCMDPNNGEILAMASKPDYSLEDFSGVTPVEVWDKLNTDPEKPLLNRAVFGQYPPGSTFKMVLATAALQEGVINSHWSVNCGGSFTFGDKSFGCTHVHGNVDVTKAIHQSCNVFFYRLMLELNNKKGWSFWRKYCSLFGFGSKTGLDIGEYPGFIPSDKYYNKMYGNKWSNGLLISLAIGQGEVNVTPIQMACYVSAIANWGKYYRPHFVHSYKDKSANKENFFPVSYREIPVSKEVWGIIRNGMYLAVNAPGGTGLAAQVPGVTVAGKTGTAQNPPRKNHAWFVCFAPYENPKIAIAIIVENGGFGGSASAPIARELIKQYLTNTNKNLSVDELKSRKEEVLKNTTETQD